MRTGIRAWVKIVAWLWENVGMSMGMVWEARRHEKEGDVVCGRGAPRERVWGITVFPLVITRRYSNLLKKSRLGLPESRRDWERIDAASP